MRLFLGLGLVVTSLLSSPFISEPSSNNGLWSLSPSLLGAMGAEGPEVKMSYFQNFPTRLFYFEDTSVRRFDALASAKFLLIYCRLYSTWTRRWARYTFHPTRERHGNL